MRRGLVAEAEATLAALEQALSAWRLAALLGGPTMPGARSYLSRCRGLAYLRGGLYVGVNGFCCACAFQAKSCSGMALL